MIPRDYQVFEIFEEIEKIEHFKNKVETLQTKFHDHTPLQRILKMNFCKTIVSVFPTGEPPFTKAESDGPERSSLWSYIKHLPYFVQCIQSQRLPALKREKIFIEMLEAIETKEAELVCLAKDGNIESRYPGITFDLATAAFPNLNLVARNVQTNTDTL